MNQKDVEELMKERMDEFEIKLETKTEKKIKLLEMKFKKKSEKNKIRLKNQKNKILELERVIKKIIELKKKSNLNLQILNKEIESIKKQIESEKKKININYKKLNFGFLKEKKLNTINIKDHFKDLYKEDFKNGNNFLHIIIKKTNNIEIIKFLINEFRKEFIRSKNNDGENIFFFVCKNFQILKFLINEFRNDKEFIKSKNNDGGNILHFSFYNNNFKISN